MSSSSSTRSSRGLFAGLGKDAIYVRYAVSTIQVFILGNTHKGGQGAREAPGLKEAGLLLWFVMNYSSYLGLVFTREKTIAPVAMENHSRRWVKAVFTHACLSKPRKEEDGKHMKSQKTNETGDGGRSSRQE